MRFSTTHFWNIKKHKLVIELTFFSNNFVSFHPNRFYQVRCSLRATPRAPIQIETNGSNTTSSTKSKSDRVVRGSGTSKIFQILYRNEEVILKDSVVFRVRLPGTFTTDKLDIISSPCYSPKSIIIENFCSFHSDGQSNYSRIQKHLQVIGACGIFTNR